MPLLRHVMLLKSPENRLLRMIREFVCQFLAELQAFTRHAMPGNMVMMQPIMKSGSLISNHCVKTVKSLKACLFVYWHWYSMLEIHCHNFSRASGTEKFWKLHVVKMVLVMIHCSGCRNWVFPVQK